MEGGTVKAILTISIYVIACDALVVDTSSWTVETHQIVTSYRAVTPARSRLDCLVRCRGSQGCDLTVFDGATGLCYLQPTLSAADGDNGLPADVCLTPKYMCMASNARTEPNSKVVSWQRSATSLTGDVTCVQDFIYTGTDAPFITCSEATSDWSVEMDGQCLQKAWRNDTVVTDANIRYPLPLSPEVGWSMCITATPTANTVFQVNLADDSGDLPLHTSVRLNYSAWSKVTVLDWCISGLYSWDANYLTDPNPPFPFTVGVQFHMRITATGTYQLSMYVDGGYYGNWSTPVGIYTISFVYFEDEVRVHSLDLYC